MIIDRSNWVFFILAAAVILWGVWFLFRGSNNPQIAEANASYMKGENAKTIAEREKNFNQALAIYQQLETDYQPNFGNGKLYFNMANTYFQLGQYPLALLNYYRALALMPREEKVKYNLHITQEKLGIDDKTTPSAFDKVFFFHTYLSLPERLQLFFLLSVIVLVFCSFYIWNKKRWTKRAIILSLILWSIILLSLGYSLYISPLEGILIHSSDLYQDAGAQYAKVLDQPVMPGSKVEVLDVAPNGKWIKILTPKGQLGYVSQDNIRLI